MNKVLTAGISIFWKPCRLGCLANWLSSLLRRFLNWDYILTSFQKQNSRSFDLPPLFIWDQMQSVIAADWHACAVQCQYSMKCLPHGRNGVLGFSTTCDIGCPRSWVDLWEPFYIGPNNVPFYDERFQKVLSNIWGLKRTLIGWLPCLYQRTGT